MINPSPFRLVMSPAVKRLAALAPLGDAHLRQLHGAIGNRRTVRTRRELQVEARAVGEPQLILSGWAARVRILADGRRQFLSFLLPGDLVGICHQPRPLAASTVIALTDVSVTPAPPAAADCALGEAYAISKALDEGYLLAHITRLGRLNAQERMADLFIELFERLEVAGLVSQNGFDLPLTQEALADSLGLTAVHINRMLQLLRRAGDVEWKGGKLTLPNLPALARKVGHVPVRVTAPA